LLGIYQTFTGHRFVPGLFSSVEENHFWPSLFAAHGTLEASTEFALLLSTFLPLPLSAWLLETERFSPQRMLALAGGLVIGAALLMNLRFEVFWVVLISSLLLIYMTKKKYFLLLLGPLALLWFSLDFWDFKQTIVTHLFDSAIWPWEMRQEIIDQQLKLFEGNPWLGIGFNQNFDSLIEFFSSQGIAHQGISGAPNAYFQLLITTGVLGLSLYLLYVLSSLLTTHRLYSNIPKSHYWHRVFALTSLGVQVAFHVSGLFVWTFGYVSMTYTFAFFLALSAYMAKHYEKGIVPDDQAL
jgi:hypothetical protein